MKKLLILSAVLVCSGILFFSSKVSASTSLTLVPTGGVDNTSTTPATFTTTTLTKLSVSDDSRIQNNGDWSSTNAYNENQYLEFNFTPTLPDNAVINSITVTNEFRRTGTLIAAKLEVWDGTQFTDEALTVGSINVDHTDTVDVSSLLSTVEKVRAMKIRFLAYRDTTGSTRTSHDFVGINLTYTVPGVNNAPVASDMTVTIPVDTPQFVSVLASDQDSDPLTYALMSSTSNGTLGLFSNNKILYTPNGTLGTDTFTFKANDGRDDSNTATVTINLVAGAASKLIVTPDRLVLPFNETSNVLIQGQDRFGNFSTGDNTTTISVTPDPGGMSAVSSFTLVNGAFNLIVSSQISSTMNYVFHGVGSSTVSGSASLAFTPLPAQSGVDGSKTVHIGVGNGTDNSGTTNKPFLLSRDPQLVALTDVFWSTVSGFWYGAFVESQYQEFDFYPLTAPTGSIFDSALLTIEWKSTYSNVYGAKLEVWNGTSFENYPLVKTDGVAINTWGYADISPTVSNYIMTGSPLKVRFLAIGGQTQINMIGVDVTYHTPVVATPPVITPPADVVPPVDTTPPVVVSPPVDTMPIVVTPAPVDTTPAPTDTTPTTTTTTTPVDTTPPSSDTTTSVITNPADTTPPVDTTPPLVVTTDTTTNPTTPDTVVDNNSNNNTASNSPASGGGSLGGSNSGGGFYGVSSAYVPVPNSVKVSNPVADPVVQNSDVPVGHDIDNTVVADIQNIQDSSVKSVPIPEPVPIVTESTPPLTASVINSGFSFGKIKFWILWLLLILFIIRLYGFRKKREEKESDL